MSWDNDTASGCRKETAWLSFFLFTTFMASLLHLGGSTGEQQERKMHFCAVPASDCPALQDKCSDMSKAAVNRHVILTFLH